MGETSRGAIFLWYTSGMGMKIRYSNGATLVELMAAVAIFMIGITALMGVYLQSMTAARRTSLVYTAYTLARNHLESLKSVQFNDLPLAAETASLVNDDGVPDLNGSFIRSTTVGVNYSGDTNLTQVTVDVNYKLSGKLSLTPIKMTTVIFQS